jgi:predicted dehydrogenase
MEPVGVGVVGLGGIGRVHAANLCDRVRGARLVRVADTSDESRRWADQALGVPSADCLDALLSDSRVGAVVIATPPPTHSEMVTLAAAAGKAILCEKPLALDIDDAERAVAAATRAGVVLQVGFHRRFDPDFMLAKERIGTGQLGAVYSFADSMRDLEPPDPATIRGTAQALLHDAACHDLDAARWLIGEIDEITTFGTSLSSDELRRAGQVDHTITVLRFASGALGTIDNSLASGYGFDCRCEIVGSKATMRIDRPFRSNVEWLSKRVSGFERTKTFLDRFEHTYATELEAFVQAIRSGSDVPVTGHDGLAAVVLTVAAQRSLETRASVALSHVSTGDGIRYAIEAS